MNSLLIGLVVGAFLLEFLSLFFPDNPLKVSRELHASTSRLWIHVAISVATICVGGFALLSGLANFRTFDGIGSIVVGLILTAYSGYAAIEGLRRLRVRRRLALARHGGAH